MMKNEAAFTQLVTELMAFAVCLKNHLRGVKTRPEELGAMLPYALIVTLAESANPPLAAIQAMASTVRSSIKTESPADAALANASFLQLSTALDALANTVGACERVKNTPTPFGYVAALRGFLLLWLFTMPFTLIGTYGVVAVPAMALVVIYDFSSVEDYVHQIGRTGRGEGTAGCSWHVPSASHILVRARACAATDTQAASSVHRRMMVILCGFTGGAL